ncbi:MAG: hypothetical protein U9Q40_11490 [Campylobacterota bacterium]|nr:hypothetical protein [Campylobacterota bacterium]
MINETVLNYILLFILLELVEVSWQKAPTIMGMLIRMYQHYKKSVILFLIMQPTFYFTIGFAILTDYSAASLFLVFIKTFDIATKILLIEQVFIKKELSQDLSLVLLAPINAFLPYIGVVLYPILIALAI